ncbi:MAG: glycosyltransferase family 87 protein, partial [Steroidobacteraceae bacterium]
AVNLLALAGIIAGSSRLLASIAGRPCTVAEVALLVTVLAGSPYTANVIWTGQSTLVVSCALVWSWVLAYSGRSLLAGVFLALASAKPQLVLLPALWLLLDRRWKVLFSAAGTAAALSAIPVVTTGIATFTQWLQATTAYMNETTVVLLLSHNLNLASVAKAFAWPGSAQLGAVFMAAGVGFTLIFYRRLRLKPDAFVIALGVLVPLSLLSFYGRDYDLAACGPTLALAMYVSRRSKADMALGILLVGALNIPHRVVEKIEPTYLIYWRPVLLLATVIWLVSWTSSRSVRHRAAPLPA